VGLNSGVFPTIKMLAEFWQLKMHMPGQDEQRLKKGCPKHHKYDRRNVFIDLAKTA